MPEPTHNTDFEVAIIGGSYAGMSAALQLARARRSVVIFDSGQRRNRFAKESHGFLTHDSSSPDHIAQVAREQLTAYPTVTWREDVVESASGATGEFSVRTESGGDVSARLLILASGVVDHLPEIDGLQDRWGGAVFSCPYCHGYELNQGRIAVIATGPLSFHQAQVLPEWGDVTFFLNDILKLDDVQERFLEIKDAEIEESSIERISGEATIELANGESMEFAGIAIATSISMSDLPSQLGCEMTDETPDAFVSVDEMQATTVDGVFACGDIARSAHTIAFAVADGTMAGTSAHAKLMETD